MKIFTFPLALLALPLLPSAQNWTPLAGGLLPLNHVVFSISAVGEHTIWAAASEELYQGPIPSSTRVWVLRSSDGGQSWASHAVEAAAGAIAFTIVAADSLTAWLDTQDYGTGPGRSLYRTTDGGETWLKKHTEGGSGVSLQRFADGQHWLAHNRQSTGRSANDGANWTTGTVSGYQSSEYQILYAGTNMACTVGDTAWNGTSAGRIVRFTQFGAASKIISTGLGTGSNITSVAFTDHLNGLCFYQNATGAGRLARTADGGETWAQVTANLPPSFTASFWNLRAIPGSWGAYAMTTIYHTPNGRVALTKDNGQTWTQEVLGESINAVAFASPTAGWVGGGRITTDEQPAIFKYTGSPFVDAKDAAAKNPGAFSVFPNPVSGDFLMLQSPGVFSGPNLSTFENLTNLRATATTPAGRVVFSGEILDNKLNVRDLPPGVYFLKIGNGGKSRAARFVKI